MSRAAGPAIGHCLRKLPTELPTKRLGPFETTLTRLALITNYAEMASFARDAIDAFLHSLIEPARLLRHICSAVARRTTLCQAHRRLVEQNHTSPLHQQPERPKSATMKPVAAATNGLDPDGNRREAQLMEVAAKDPESMAHTTDPRRIKFGGQSGLHGLLRHASSLTRAGRSFPSSCNAPSAGHMGLQLRARLMHLLPVVLAHMLARVPSSAAQCSPRVLLVQSHAQPGPD